MYVEFVDIGWMIRRDCIVCGFEVEDWGYGLDMFIGEDGEERGVDDRVRWILDGSGQGGRCMRELERRRNGRG